MLYCLTFRNKDGNVDKMLIEIDADSDMLDTLFSDFKRRSTEVLGYCDLQEFPSYLVRRRIPFNRLILTKLFFAEG